MSNMTVVWDEEGRSHELATTDASEILALIGGLNGRDRTLVTVFRGEAHTSVGGSASTGVVMYVTFDQQHFHQLAVGEPTADPNVFVSAGGQVGEYKAHLVVDLEVAKAALLEFLEHGTLSNEQRWETS
jgi:hypothetical protein